MNSIINYSLNKFCPYVVISFLLFYESEFSLIRSLIIIGLCMFVDKFSFKAGFSYAYCIKNKIPLDR